FGFRIDFSDASIKNCIVEHNEGLGIGGQYCNIYLSNTTIRYNHGNWGAGGIGYGLYMEVEYDSINRCNIYCNYGAVGCEISKSWFSPSQEIYVDTFTVFEPDYHFVYSYDTYNLPVDDIEMHIQHAYLTPVDHDLYVNPITGNNSNSGLSPEEPLKTVAHANSLIKPDSLNHRTIHLANGVYSVSTNDEKLPWGSRSFISIRGESRDSTIIDAENLYKFYLGYGLMHHCKLENLTMQYGKSGIYTEDFNFLTFKNIEIKDGGNDIIGGFAMGGVDSLIIEGCYLRNLIGGSGIGNNFPLIKHFFIKDILIDNNGPDFDSQIFGGGFGVGGYLLPPFSYLGSITNLQITNNLAIHDPLGGSTLVSGFGAGEYCKVNVVNATIGHNVARTSIGFGTNASMGSELNIYNSILYGDSLRELSLGHPSITSDPSTCRVYYSDIEGGQGEVMNWNNINTLVWGPGNIDSDPLWDTTAAIPYALPWNSPCVNAGTPMYEPGMQPPYIIEEDTVYKLITFDYDTIVLPTTDLAGNPRIFGGRIDMGAYECQDTLTGSKKEKTQSEKLKVQVYPNPFCYNTFIMFDLGKKAIVQAVIYDMKGNEVKRLMDASVSPGKYNLTWSGDDDSGQMVESGIYFFKLFLNG
ncbi:MAG: T9SS type A sorting domain-containing protein, partial [Bacteroidetes bacterium]|nr:T9SS type A sorting domain-containing protein [Bacteroidota bacterium]